MDDCWQVYRDANGTIHADPLAFPSGIPVLADYIHSRKLKFGLYSGRIIRLGFYHIFISALLYQTRDLKRAVAALVH